MAKKKPQVEEEVQTKTQDEFLETVKKDATQDEPPVITVADFEKMIAIINIATERGAVRPNELTNVGMIYDKLVTFMNYVQTAQQRENDAEKTQTPKTD